MYEAKLDELSVELVKMQYWIKDTGQKLVILSRGGMRRGRAGRSSALQNRSTRVAAARWPWARPGIGRRPSGTSQRYVAHLPAAGEIVVFDRSWYNRAGVERVMGFCSDEEYEEFMRACPEFERMLVRSGVRVLNTGFW